MAKTDIEIKTRTHILFFALLSILLVVYTFYDESLNEKSHQAILDLQRDYPQSENTAKVSRAIFI